MGSTTIKHETFVKAPLGEKPVTAIPGVGLVLGGKLNAKGYNTARQLYEKAVQMNFNSLEFKEWLMSACGAKNKYASDCFEALYDWHNMFGNRSRISDSFAAAKPRNSHLELLDECDHMEESFRRKVQTNDDDATKDFFIKCWKTVDTFPHSLKQQVLGEFREILNEVQRKLNNSEKVDKYYF